MFRNHVHSGNRIGMIHLVVAGIIGIGLTAIPAGASLIAEEHFLVGDPAVPASGEYAIGGVVGQGPAVLGFTGTWSVTSTNAPNVQPTPGLFYSNSSGTVASAGGSLKTDSTNNRAGRQLSTAITGSTSGTYYISFLLKVGSVASSNNYKTFGFYNGSAGSSDRVLAIGNTTNGDSHFYLAASGQGSVDLGDANANTNLIVLRLDLSDQAGQDSVTVYRNPADLASEPASGATLSNINVAFNYIALERFANQSIAVDEFRLGTTYNDVTTVPAPEPASAALLIIAGGLLLAPRNRSWGA